jgi:WD40 repeat protein
MSLTLPTVTGNPFVGPRAFRAGEHLYARERETQRIVDLLIAERIVLLYSPSGAGKTSLINAALIPELVSERFQVSPVVRVSMHRPAAAADGDDANRYVLSTLLSLEEGVPPDQQRDLGELRQLTIDDYLRDWATLDEVGPGNELLIFDQFEEILTADATDEAARQRFFTELGEALRDRDRWALFAMREEFVAGLDPYVSLLPTKLRTRFRLDLLEQDAARRAIQQPAATAGRAISDEAAQRLVDELRLVNVQRGEERVQRPGPFIEPVQLQVVCARLWDAVGPEVDRIEVEHLEALGDVERTLGDYYADRVGTVAAATGVPERWIRDWFDDELITSTGFRAQLPHGPRAAGAAEATVVAGLEDAHLIRSEDRRGTRWIELAHDRLIEPVREDNARWRAVHLSDLQRQAARWHAAGRKEEFLLTGGALDAAAERIAEHAEELTPVEQDFWDASAYSAYRRQRRGRLAIGISVVLLIALVASLVAVAVAVRQSVRANEQASVADAAAAMAREQERIARSRQLATEASNLLDERPETAMLLAVEGVRQAPTHEALTALAASLSRPMTQVQEQWFQRDDDLISAVALSADGRTIVTQGTDRLNVWDAASGERLNTLRSPESDATDGERIAISPDGTRIAAASWSGLRLWDATSGEPIRDVSIDDIINDTIYGEVPDAEADDELWMYSPHVAEPLHLAFSPDGASIVVAGGNLWRFDGVTGERDAAPLVELRSQATAVAFSPDGTTIATGDIGGEIRLWDASSGRPVTGWPNQQLELARSQGGTTPVAALAFSPDGGTIASGGGDGVIRLWGAGTGLLREELSAAPQGGAAGGGEPGDVSITSLAFGRDGALLVAGVDDWIGGTAQVWDVARGTRVMGAVSSAEGVAMSPSESTVVTANGELLDVWQVVHVKQPLGRPTFTVTGPVAPTARDVTVSPDGRLAAAGTDAGAIQVWELATGAPRWRARSGTDEPGVLSVTFSPSGDLIASGGTDGAVRLWDVADGTPRGERVTAHEDFVRTVAFSPEGTLVASVSDDGTLRLWGAASMEPQGEPMTGPDGWVRAVAFSPDGELIATAADDGTIRLWDVATAEPRGGPLRGNDEGDDEGGSGVPSQLAFSADGTMLAHGMGNAVRIWDLSNLGQPTTSVELGGSDWSLALAFSPDGDVLAAATDERTVARWHTDSGEPIETPDIEDGPWFASAAFSPDGGLLVTGGGEVETWDLASGDRLRILLQEDDDGLTRPAPVDRMVFSPDGSRLAISSGGRIELRGAGDGAKLGEELVGDEESIERRDLSMAFIDAGDRLLLVDEVWHVDDPQSEVEVEVEVWDWETSPGRNDVARLDRPEALMGASSRLEVSPDGTLLAAGGEDGAVHLWSTASGELQEPLVGHDDAVTSIAFGPDGGVLAAGASDGTVRLWDVATRTERGQRLVGHGAAVTELAFDANGELLASGDANGGVRSWDVATGESHPELRRVNDAFRRLESLAVGDGSVIVIDGSGSVQLWDAASGLPRGELSVGVDSRLTSVAIAPDARHVAIGSDDGAVRIIPTDPSRWLELACETVSRNLRQDEWEASFGSDVPYRRTCSNHPEAPPIPAPTRTPDPDVEVSEPSKPEAP